MELLERVGVSLSYRATTQISSAPMASMPRSDRSTAVGVESAACEELVPISPYSLRSSRTSRFRMSIFFDSRLRRSAGGSCFGMSSGA